MERDNDYVRKSDPAEREKSYDDTFRRKKYKAPQDRSVIISMALSKLLRHEAKNAGISLDEEAYARVDEVLEWHRLKLINATFTDIQNAANNNSKQRFSMKLNPSRFTSTDLKATGPSDWMIRANQGHTLNVDASKLLCPATLEAGNLPDTAIHGTFYYFYSSIIETGGLSRISRNHIHFVTDLKSTGYQVISDMRKDTQILIYVDVRASLEDGISWWLSSNGVLLTEGNSKGLVPMKYFKKVISKDPDIGLLVENGVEIKKLPENLRYLEPPLGKNHVSKKLQNRNERRKVTCKD